MLGVLRLGLNADYDRIAELANQHKTLRQMLGHADWTDESQWHLQTLKDNLRLFTPELLERINQVVVAAGHTLVKKSPDDTLAVRCDAFVVETDVHFPTDINLLYDAVRKAIETSAQLCEDLELSDWRQSAHNVRCLKQAYRRAQQLKRSTAKDEARRAERSDAIKQAHRDDLELAESFLACARDTRAKLGALYRVPAIRLVVLDEYIAHGARQIDQIDRRVLQGGRIPHVEKTFSIFEPHTGWINKGKVGVVVELGLRVAVSGDQQGFHSPANQRQLADIIDFPVLPKKGKCSAAEHEREHDPRFARLRRRHSGVESAINALEVHGTAWTCGPITASTASSATSPWPWLGATSTASAPSCRHRRGSRSNAHDDERPEPSARRPRRFPREQCARQSPPLRIALDNARVPEPLTRKCMTTCRARRPDGAANLN